MHRPRRTTSTPRRLLAAATWLLLLGGLFAMHGLAPMERTAPRTATR